MPPNHHDHVNGQKQIFKKPLGVCSKNSNKKKKEEVIPSVSVPYLNDDIMRSIFIRVPAISLFDNCSFLSKQCSKLIYNQSFIKAHLLQSNPGILLTEIQGEDVEVFKFMEFKETQIVNVHHLLHTSMEEMTLCSDSAGLSMGLDRNSGHRFLLNLITREIIWLPTLREKHFKDFLLFDRANMNYKILYFTSKLDNERNVEQTITLLDLDGSCKRIKGPKNTPMGTPVLVNGVLYCDAIHSGLFCLDLSTEIFSYLRWPIPPDSYSPREIMDVGGFLGLMTLNRSGIIDIWILRGKKWVHRCCINKETRPREGLAFFLGCLGSDEDLFVFTWDHSRLDAYNLKTKQWTMIKPSDKNCCRSVIHVPTILPLPF